MPASEKLTRMRSRLRGASVLICLVVMTATLLLARAADAQDDEPSAESPTDESTGTDEATIAAQEARDRQRPLTSEQIRAVTIFLRSWEEDIPDRPDWREPQAAAG